jgi:biotin carboxyl carrier protein
VERSGDGFEVVFNGCRHAVDLICLDGAVASLRYVDDGRSFQVAYQHDNDHHWRVGVRDREYDLSVLTPVEAIDEVASSGGRGPSRITAPIPGKVVSVSIEPGDDVAPGQSLVVLEAMKMENELTADQAGRVAEVHVKPGDTVDSGAVLVELE